jgi:hypothetical protein
MRCLDQERDNVEPKEQMLTAEFYSEGIVVGESLFLGNSSMAKNLEILAPSVRLWQ